MTKAQHLTHSHQQNHSGGLWSRLLAILQRVGKSLMFPIAVLPIAALLLRLGALIEDPLSNRSLDLSEIQIFIGKIIKTPGEVIFTNLPIIFAIGIAFGLAKDNRGEAALVGAIVWFGMTALLGKGLLPEIMYGKLYTFEDVTDNGTQVYSNLFYFYKSGTVIYQLDTGVFGGIIVGAVVASLYNRFKDIKLPTALSFFGGRRFIPMLGVLSVIPLAAVFAAIWPWAQFGLIKVGTGLSTAPTEWKGVATGGYAIFNRLLQPFGLHHIPNTFVWFQLPISGEVLSTGETLTVNGDINAFQKGIIGSGLFTSGFFPLFLGGLPGAALAMIMTADRDKRSQMAWFYSGAAFVAFLTGIDEPLIFSFIFISPLLYIVNAILTGVFYAAVIYSQISIGFGFSAGLIDYIISFATSWNMADRVGVIANPLWIWAYAAVMFVVYYLVFYFIIVKMKVPTPGRELILGLTRSQIDQRPMNAFSDHEDELTHKGDSKDEKYQFLANQIITNVGMENIVLVDNCATRLRLTVKDNSEAKINDLPIREAGARGFVRLGKQGYQVIIGTDVEHVANKINEAFQQHKTTSSQTPIVESLSFDKNTLKSSGSLDQSMLDENSQPAPIINETKPASIITLAPPKTELAPTPKFFNDEKLVVPPIEKVKKTVTKKTSKTQPQKKVTKATASKAMPKKRGPKPKNVQATLEQPVASALPKKRGPKPKNVQATLEQPVASALPKKRGPKPKSLVTTPQVATSKKLKTTLAQSTPKKRGPKPKKSSQVVTLSKNLPKAKVNSKIKKSTSKVTKVLAKKTNSKKQETIKSTKIKTSKLQKTSKKNASSKVSKSLIQTKKVRTPAKAKKLVNKKSK